MFVFNRAVVREEAGPSDTGGGGGGDAPRTFTQDQMNALLAKEKRAWQDKFSALETQLKEAAPFKEQFEKLREEQELAGKTALEQAEIKRTKDLALAQKQIEEARKLAADHETAARTVAEQLHRERVTVRLGAELTRAKVMPQFADKAVKLAMLEIADVQIDDSGKVTASYGDHIERPLAEVVAAWVKDNENFLPAPNGGAGTRGPNSGSRGVPLSKQSTEDLVAQANELRGRR